MSRLRLLTCFALALGGTSALAAQAVATQPDTVAIRWAKRLLQSMHAAELFAQGVDSAFARQRQADPSIPAVFYDSLTARVRKSVPEITDSIAFIYAHLLSAADLEGVVRFYESPLGQRLAQAQTAAQRETADMARRWGMRLARDVYQNMVDQGLAPSPYVTSMKADLRNLVTAEEAYFADSVKYTEHFPALRFNFSTGNRLVTLKLTADGWWAQVSNANTTATCAIFIGSTPAPPAVREGEPQCR